MLSTLAVLVPLLVAAPSGPRDFALKDGDRVVFLGDSITAARTYGKIIEDYTLLRFPDRKVGFFNAGQGGDTAAGGLTRLERDVFNRKTTVLIVAFGTNDIGWGALADEPHKRKYLDSIRGIVEQCRKRKVRVFICSAAVTAADPDKSEDSFLQKMCDEGMALARKGGGRTIDVQRAMRSIQKKILDYNKRTKGKEKVSLHLADGVHLNDLGQLAMAWAILKGLGAPADVSSVHLDAQAKKVVAASGCKVTDLVQHEDGRLEFTRLDEGLPFNRGLFYALNYRFVPVPDDLARYLLRVENLPEGRYEVTADGRGLGTFTARDLARGLNMAWRTANAWQPGGPWDAQASVLKALTDARHNLAIAGVLSRAYVKETPLSGQMTPGTTRSDEELVALQRLAARPRPYRFVIRKAEPKKKKP
jgi:lysophospholipase L1-like esterase